eukprot:scaffold10997_cov119-Isochrysis_galbana.AAC.5
MGPVPVPVGARGLQEALHTAATPLPVVRIMQRGAARKRKSRRAELGFGATRTQEQRQRRQSDPVCCS